MYASSPKRFEHFDMSSYSPAEQKETCDPTTPQLKMFSKWPWAVSESELGAKDAYLKLKASVKDWETEDTQDLVWSKRYLIVSVEHMSLEDALKRRRLTNLYSVKRTAIGCIAMSDTEYLFFWRGKSTRKNV